MAFKDDQQSCNQEEVPKFHNPSEKKSQQTDSICPIPSFDDRRTEKVTCSFVIVVCDVVKEDKVAADFDQVENDTFDRANGPQYHFQVPKRRVIFVGQDLKTYVIICLYR
jgi:hypothetical protein